MTDLTPPVQPPPTVVTPLPPSVTADPRRAEGLDHVPRQVLAGSTGLTVETRADEAVALGLLLSAAGRGDQAAQTTLATLGVVPRFWRELRARVPLSPHGTGSPVNTPGSVGPQPLAVTRPRSRVSLGQPPAGATA
ncbi:hypothetical protein [Streptomyces anandii]|uniref:hypothetical protein n=1 Tax=Streptomyces anandii TaxID=285454 RepID=UPI0016733461|nr:hypothetical protein [Streptomyces anandii]GGX94702.1 hypothetical protein GCM10010510_44890 [Streptomyces anandii JCM 4720]